MEKSLAGVLSKVTLLAVVAIVASSLLLITARPAHAATFTVNSTGDSGDQAPGDGSCFTGQFLDPAPGSNFRAGECTLRAAIQQANANKVKDTINFAIPGAGPHIISPASQLPGITRPVTINGYTESLDEGANPARANTAATGTDAVLKIVLDGPGNTSQIGLPIGASNSTVKGLVINGFAIGINLNSDDNVIAGNFIGTDVLGTTPSPNLFEGVFVSSGNSGFATNNTIGGTTPTARNLIAGNGQNGVGLGRGARGTRVIGNLIGTRTGSDGTLGNGLSGVSVFEGAGNTIGGDGAASNTIAFNGRDGVSVSGTSPGTTFGTGNRILGNSIFFNSGLGIDLGDDGVTANDAKDTDTGSNRLQNYPVISSAVISGGSTTIRGSLNSTPGKRFTLRFFSISGPAVDPSGFGEGQTFLGQKKVETNKQGNASFTFVPSQAVPGGQRVTATATGPGGNTSEFSRVVAAEPPP